MGGEDATAFRWLLRPGFFLPGLWLLRLSGPPGSGNHHEGSGCIPDIRAAAR